jgi:hypothetical protein
LSIWISNVSASPAVAIKSVVKPKTNFRISMGVPFFSR